MPIATRTFRIFVSSTFEDLKDERDALQRDVFPKLRALCEQHGARFQAIDLRWGVRDEAALDQQTMAICLREIQRCKATGVRPNFIALIGDRYGWQPLPVTIPAAELEALKPRLSVGDAKLSEKWYRLDENAVPLEYCLQPRTGEFVEPSAWNPVEQSLLQALATAARAARFSDKELVKYEASATHQEILAGLGETEEDRQHVFGFVRRPNGNTDPRLEALKSHLRVHEFGAGDMKGLCELVLTQLTGVIEAEVKRFEDRPALDLEIEAHDRFAEERCRVFIGRESALDMIADYIRGPERRPLVLHGESGSGKSAVMAKASRQYEGPGRVIRRFIGASPESASGHALLTSLCQQLAPGETPVDYAQLENAFRERMSVATAEQPLVLFIDALDQLAASDPARDVTWLPPELPLHVKVILSTTDDGERLPEGVPFRLERMAQTEGGQALDELLNEAHRTLQPWQRNTVLAHFERCGLPLYLKLAAEESKPWKSYTQPDACTLGEGIAGVIDTLFARLASNSNHGPVLVERSLGYLAAARYGLTEAEVLDVLTVDDAVWNDFDQRKHHQVTERRLPVVVWSRLSLDLEPYLTERAAPGGTVITFYHRQLGERVVRRFLAGVELEARHGDLARYFSGRVAPSTRRAVELVFQQREAHQWTAAEATLFDSQFLFAKVAANLVLDLDADYQVLLEDAPKRSLSRREALRLIHGALRLSLHVVAQDPAQFASQIVGRLLAHRDEPDVARFLDEITAAAPRPWLRPLHPCLDPPGSAMLRTLTGHSSSVHAVTVTPDSKRAVSCADDHTLKVWDLDTGRLLRTLEGHSNGICGVALTPDGNWAVSASMDTTVRVWDLETGRELQILEGHTGSVLGIAITPEGRRAISASNDDTLKVWDLDGGCALRTLQCHSLVRCVAVTPDGRRAVSGSKDHTLKVWDLATGRELRRLEGHNDEVVGVAITRDGRLMVSASWDRTLKVWDLKTGRQLRTLAGHSGFVHGVAITPDGKRVISASDPELKVWDLETGRELHTLEGHSISVLGVAVTPNGRRAISASDDRTLKVWDITEHALTGDAHHALAAFKGHSERINAVASTPNGKRAVSASADHTLKAWEPGTGRDIHTLVGHSARVNAVAMTPDGKRAVSASEDHTLKLWDLDTGVVLRTLDAFHTVYVVALVPDGKLAISATVELRVWDLETGCSRLLWGGLAGRDRWGRIHRSSINCVAVTPDRRSVVCATAGILKVLDLETGQEAASLKTHSYWVRALAVTPDGRRAISSSDDAVTDWDLAGGGELRRLERADDVGGYALALTPDGKRAVSDPADKVLKVWDMETSAGVAVFHCEAAVECCTFGTPNLIVAGDLRGRIYFLNLEE